MGMYSAYDKLILGEALGKSCSYLFKKAVSGAYKVTGTENYRVVAALHSESVYCDRGFYLA